MAWEPLPLGRLVEWSVVRKPVRVSQVSRGSSTCHGRDLEKQEGSLLEGALGGGVGFHRRRSHVSELLLCAGSARLFLVLMSVHSP